jgi:septum formation protein
MSIDFVLASASPSRRKLLQSMGINPFICASNFNESKVQLSDPVARVETLAQRKVEAVKTQFRDSLILGCDSMMTMDGKVYGKPRDRDEAFVRWQEMRGNRGTIYTGHALFDQRQNQMVVRCGITQVYFSQISDLQIRAYIATGEPLACAGCFALEGKGSALVDKIEGCHTNVIGLSLPLFRSMLAELRYNLSDYWGLPLLDKLAISGDLSQPSGDLSQMSGDLSQISGALSPKEPSPHSEITKNLYK